MEHVITDAITGEITVIPFTPEEIATQQAAELENAWKSIRENRNKLLSESDWTQVSDAPVDKAAWAVYRQALRDLPNNTEDPFNPVWPLKP